MSTRKGAARKHDDDQFNTVLNAMDKQNARRRDAMRRIEEYSERRRLRQELNDWDELF